MTFNVKFNYFEIEYSADVLKIPLVNDLPVQWHVFNISPSIPNVLNPYMFIYEPQKKIFSFGLFNNSSELGNTIFNSIKAHCVEYGISIIE